MNRNAVEDTSGYVKKLKGINTPESVNLPPGVKASVAQVTKALEEQ